MEYVVSGITKNIKMYVICQIRYELLDRLIIVDTYWQAKDKKTFHIIHMQGL